MHRVNRVLGHLQARKCAGDEVSSLDVFEFMNAILNGGKGGGINDRALRDKGKLRRVFDKMDLDGNGSLDRAEFATAARLCSLVITDADIDDIFRAMSGGSKSISFDGFGKAIQSLLDSVKVDFEKYEALDKDVKLVMGLWDKHMNGNKRAAELFTKELVSDPALRTLKNVDLNRQVSMVFGMISNAFRGLPDQDRLVSRLVKEGSRHFYTFGMKDTHYDVVRRVLFKTLPQVMGEDYDFYARMQFEKYWSVIQDAMVQGYNDR